MASLPDDPPEKRYHRIIFYDARKSPKRKTVYLKRSSHYGKAGYTLSQAKDWKKRREILFTDGEWDPWGEHKTRHRPGPHTLATTIEKYISHAGRELAASTVESRHSQLKVFAKRFGRGRLLANLDREQVEGWVNDDRNKYKTKMKRLEVVNALFRYAGKRGWMDQMELQVYARSAEKKRAKRPDKTWVRPEEYGKVKRAAMVIHEERMKNNYAGSATNEKYREFEKEFDFIFDFLINTGLRRADFLHLSTGWFFRGFKMMKLSDAHYQPKSQEASEIIPLTPAAQSIARRWREKYGTGVRPFAAITPDWMTKFFKAVFRRALPDKADRLSLHKMRDSAVMYLLFEKGYSPQTVQQITRHEDISTLMIYTHWAPDEALKEIENES